VPLTSTSGRLIQSRVFRLTLVSALVFSITTVLLVGIIYWSGTTAISRQIDATIDAEIKGLSEQYSQRGGIGLIRVIERRSRTASRTGALYLLVGPDGRPLAGNLSRWPEARPNAQGRIRFPLKWRMRARTIESVGRARIFNLRGGLRLLVGQDLRERQSISDQLESALIWGGTALVVLALAMGALLSWVILRRIDTISSASNEIIAGDLSRRVPVKGKGDEFDRLATTLNTMLEQNERLFRGLQEVAENIAHDLRSPLGRLRTRLETIQAEHLEGEPRQAAIGDAIEDSDRLLRTFNAILKIAQAESGAPKRHFNSVNLKQLLADLHELYEPIVETAGLQLICALPPDAEFVSGDRDLLFQAAVNLIDNAMKYAGAAKTISAKLTTTMNQAVIEISDNGPGMPPEALIRAKDRFFRVDGSRTTQGSGLGLSLVDAVARLHDGALELVDNEPGLSARITLPLDTNPPTPHKADNENAGENFA
jgi:signal transduction histidine kinase